MNFQHLLLLTITLSFISCTTATDITELDLSSNSKKESSTADITERSSDDLQMSSSDAQHSSATVQSSNTNDNSSLEGTSLQTEDQASSFLVSSALSASTESSNTETTATPVPAIIQMEDYDAYNEIEQSGDELGPDVLPSEDIDGTEKISWTGPGEWAEFLISVATADTFDLILRAATAQTAVINISIDGSIIETKTFTTTGGWTVWKTLPAIPLTLGAGEHTLRISWIENGLDINYFEIAKHTEPPEPFAFCPAYQDYSRVATIETADPNGMDLIEISGTAVSHSQTHNNGEVLWVHNDSGGGARVSAISAVTGERLKSYRLNGVPDTDYEDIAVAPCVDQAGSCVYLANVGNNVAREQSGSTGFDAIYIYKFPEPDVATTADNALITDITILEMDYRSGTSPTNYADCEGIFVDPTGDSKGGAAGDIYLISKWDTRDITKGRLFKYPYAAQSSARYHLEVVSTQVQYTLINRADISSDGSRIAIGNYDHVWHYSRAPNQTIVEAFEAGSCPYEMIFPADMACTQLEALAFTLDGNGLYEVSEQTNCSSVGLHKTVFQ